MEQVWDQAVTFADTDYAEALIAGDAVTADQRTQIAAQLARFTSLSVTDITAANLRVPLVQFQTSLVKDEGAGMTLSQYDGRMASVIQDPNTQDPTDLFTPSFLAGVSEMLATVGVVETKQYVDVYSPPTWSGANPDGQVEGGYLNVLDDLSAFIERNPNTHILVASGYYDFSCPAAEVKYMLAHLPADDAAKIQVARYEAGHPVYFGRRRARQVRDGLGRALRGRARAGRGAAALAKTESVSVPVAVAV